MKLDTFTFYLFLHCECYIVTVCLVGGLVFAESRKESHFSPDSTVPMLLHATLNIFLKLQGFYLLHNKDERSRSISLNLLHVSIQVYPERLIVMCKDVILFSSVKLTLILYFLYILW